MEPKKLAPINHLIVVAMQSSHVGVFIAEFFYACIVGESATFLEHKRLFQEKAQVPLTLLWNFIINL